MNSTLYGEKRTTLRKTCILSVFQSVMYQNTKKNGNPSIWGIETIFFRHKNIKNHGKHPIWEYKRTIPKTCLFGLFSFLCTKTLKRMQNTLYGEIE